MVKCLWEIILLAALQKFAEAHRLREILLQKNFLKKISLSDLTWHPTPITYCRMFFKPFLQASILSLTSNKRTKQQQIQL